MVFKDSFLITVSGVKKSVTVSASGPKLYVVPASRPSGKTPQIVAFSFDGSRSLSFWDSTFAFEDEMEKAGKPIRFTYFISGVYFLAPEFKNLYVGPGHESGFSMIGFADSAQDVHLRITKVNEAVERGNEIGSHANGHFDGSGWSVDEWNQELKSFNHLVFNVAENNHLDAASNQLLLKPTDIVGFRAPLLAHNNAMYTALAENGYRYDGSRVALHGGWPEKLADGLWEFPLETIKFKEADRYSISMDYSIFQMQTLSRNTLKKATPQWNNELAQIEATYLDYFKGHYDGSRAPVFIANHFALWNDGLYWEATKNVAREICGKPEVYCVTYREMMKYLDSKTK